MKTLRWQQILILFQSSNIFTLKISSHHSIKTKAINCHYIMHFCSWFQKSRQRRINLLDASQLA